MKTFPLIALLVFVIFGLSTTAAFAFNPSCDPEYRKVQQDHADGQRARNKAYGTQVIKKPDPSGGLTCFDQALKTTSRLGTIFSDVVTIPRPPNLTVFNPVGGVAFPRFGFEDLLSRGLLSVELDQLVTPVFSGFLGNFTGTLSEMLGTTIGTALSGFVGLLSDGIGGIMSGVSDAMSSISTVTSAIARVTNLVRIVLPGTPPIAVPGVVGLIGAARGALDSLMGSFQSGLSGVVSGFLGNITGITMGPQADIIDCDRMGDLWNDYNPAAGAHSIIGDGIEMGTPYFYNEEFLYGDVIGAGADFMRSLESATSSTAITKAAASLMLLGAPGGIPSWKQAPTFSYAATTEEIISAMTP